MEIGIFEDLRPQISNDISFDFSFNEPEEQKQPVFNIETTTLNEYVRNLINRNVAGGLAQLQQVQ